MDAVLRRAADEAARLLGADGAFLYLYDPLRRVLRLTHASPATALAPDHYIRDVDLPVGTGLFGRAVEQRRVMVTGDYLGDPTFTHTDPSDRFAGEVGLRSLVVAPMLAGEAVFGALGTFSGEEDAFTAPQIGLVRALADHAALAMANARLIDEIARSREAVARQAVVERSLRELGTRISAARDLDSVVQHTIDEALRLLGGAGARIDTVDLETALLRGIYAAGEEEILAEEWPRDPNDRLEVGASGKAVTTAKTYISPDYLADGNLVHGMGPDTYVRSKGIRGVIASPLIGDLGAFGAITVWSTEPDAFDADDAGLLETIAGQAAVALVRERLEQELRASEERYRFLVENSPDVIYATDADGVITYFSGAAVRSLGWEASEVVGRNIRDLARTPAGAPAGRRFAEFADGRDSLTTRMELLGKDGDHVPFEVIASAVRVDGRFAGVHGAARDIRERERLEAELRGSEERYRYLVQSSPDLVWMTDANGRFTFVSDQATSILGWSPEELLGRGFADLAPPDGRRVAVTAFRALQRRPSAVYRMRFRVRTRDGRERAMEVTAVGMTVGGRFDGAHGAARDVSDRERLEQDLRRQAAELASSEERAHLARELHDSVTQALFSMTLLSRSIELLLVKDPSQVPERLEMLRELQHEALAEMRALIFELRPGNIEEHGLVTALRTHSASLSGRIGLPVVVDADLPDRPAIDVEEGLYRIAQEALHNVVKHAAAHEVHLAIGRVPEGVRLRVTDDGRGFNPGAVPDGHLGLAGMRARAERLGGRLVVTSSTGQGTSVEVVVPEVRSEPAGRGGAAGGRRT